MDMIHGANIFKYSQDGDILDFSSNINPLGPPPVVYDIIKRNIKTIERYPDIEYRKLIQDISEAYGVREDQIAIGNGAIELIDRVISEHERIIVFDPSFSEYEIRSRAYGKKFVHMNLLENFSIDLENLKSFDFKEGDLLVITNPNNPNGRLLSKEEYESILDIINRTKTSLMMDEAFIEFADPDYSSMDYLGNRLYIIRAATKFYALPGLRLGILISSAKNIKRIRELVPSWSVGALLEGLGEIFKDTDYKFRSQKYIREERDFLMEGIMNLEGIRSYESQSNFILINLGDYNEEYVFQEFLKRKILIRKCSSYRNLNGNFIRIAVKDRRSNLKLLKGLEEIING